MKRMVALLCCMALTFSSVSMVNATEDVTAVVQEEHSEAMKTEEKEAVEQVEEVVEEEKFETGTEATVPTLMYQTHIQNVGWQDWRKSGELAGTEGQSLRMEALRLKMNGAEEYEGELLYRVHVQTIGWQDWKKNGELAGTEGQSLRVEAIEIKLTGELAEKFDVHYQVHIADFGWLDMVSSGQISGTQGFAKRMEAMRIKLVEKSDSSTLDGRGYVRGFNADEVEISGHVQNVGDVFGVHNGGTLGTVGQSLRIEGLNIKLNNEAKELVKGDIEYAVHVQDYGWMDWEKNGEFAGTRGESKRIEAIRIRLTGELEKHYNVYYRTHVQNLGWLGWASNGQYAGSAKMSYRMEAVEIKLVPKFLGAPGSTLNCYREGKTGWYYEGGYKFYYNKGVKVTDVRSIIGPQSSYEIKINKQMSTVTVYAKDGANGYIIPIVAFACSPGADTPVGIFYTPAKYRWQQLFGAMGQWCTRITGHVLFHSPPYTSFNNRTLWPKEYNKLGTWASQGCVRLRSGDAKWIYDNCALGTKVTIYNSSTSGPLGKPVYAKIPLSQTWDPTDPTVK